MNSQNQYAAQTQKELDDKLNAIKRCGANMGPHDYIPIVWNKSATAEQVNTLLCRVCFRRVSMKTLLEAFTEATF